MNDEGCFSSIFILVVAAIVAIGAIWGTGILYGIVPALIIAPLGSIIFVRCDREKIVKGKVLQQFGMSIMIALVISIIIALGSFFFHSKYDHATSMTISIAFIITLLSSGCASILLTKQTISEEEKIEKRNEREITKKKRAKEKEEEIEKKYGVCGQKILNPKSLENDYLVRVFFEPKMVILKKYDVFPFSDIVRCTIEKREEEGQTIETTKTKVSDNKSIIGRSVAGALVAGTTGAIIGGLTANKKDKEEWRFVTCTIEKYKVLIYTKKPDVPIVTIDTDKDFALAENIKNTIDAIIAMA